MKTQVFAVFLMVSTLSSPLPAEDRPPVSKESVRPGETVKLGEKTFHLVEGNLKVGKPLPECFLTDTSMADRKTSDLLGKKVLLISVVPSLDTPVCEVQTHILGEEGDGLPENVERITISRDLPFAQKRFAKEAGLEDLLYLSDFKQGDFGKSTGLLIEELGILARAVIVVDRQGIVRYLQVVPVIASLPDMEKAFEACRKAVEQDK